jgi:GT2 family glycosyltransferase/glycosyltransferase involved in cell wall biosynthesis
MSHPGAARRWVLDNRTPNPASTPSVSVVIPTYNRVDMLVCCLRALQAQCISRADYEVVVVDDGSTDGTPAALREWTPSTEMALRAYSRPNSGPAAARNEGIGRARGALIAFVDDDCIPEPDWLKNLIDALPLDASCAGIGGRIVGASDALISRYVDWRGLLAHQRTEEEINYLVTANALFHKHCLLQVGGFNECFRWAGGEDPELARRLRARGYYFVATERALVVHRHRETLRGFVDMASRYGRGAAVDAQLRGRSLLSQRVEAFGSVTANIRAEVRACLMRDRGAPIDRLAHLGLAITWRLAYARAYAKCSPARARDRAAVPAREPAPGVAAERAFEGPNARRQSARLWWLIRHRSLARDLLRTRVLETVGNDVRTVLRIVPCHVVPWMKYMTGRVLLRADRKAAAFSILAKLHQDDACERASRLAEQVARQTAADAALGGAAGPNVFRDYARDLQPPSWAVGYFRDPCSILGRLALVIKPRTETERGVLVLKYNYTFSHMNRFFDIDRVASAYHVVLEPSWSGYCTLDILQFCSVSAPVFVEAAEPRDAAFIRSVGANLVALPLASNWWVDHRIFRPLPGTRKDTDVVMIATWARYKRHFEFFRVLGALRRRGRRLRVSLIGYPGDMTRHDVAEMAAFFGVADQVDLHEDIPQTRVNQLLNRAKVSLIWSLKEGVNRAIIESMFAGVPCILRDGFNYGYKYPYVNERTGCFTSEADLPQTLLGAIRDYDRFAPRDWVAANMTCQRATARLEEAIAARAKALGEPWSGGIAVKTNALHTMEYWNVEERDRFAADYAYLRQTLRG